MMLYDPRTEDWIDDSELFLGFDPEVDDSLYDGPGDYVYDDPEEFPWTREDRI